MLQKNSKKFLKEYYCEKCDYYTSRKGDFKKHCNSKKHNATQMLHKNKINENKKCYVCSCGKHYKHHSSYYRHSNHCKYKNQYNISNHNDNEIQNKNVNFNKAFSKNDKKMDKNGQKMLKMLKNAKCPFLCDCGKSYKHQSSYSRHCQTCKFAKNNNQIVKYNNQIVKYNENNNEDITKMIMKVLEKNTEILEKNDEMMEKIVEIAKEPKTTITNNNNQQFNVMQYLNTECKDAMNFSDFINDFVFSLDDLNLLHEKGYQEAMEQTFIKQLQDMDKTKRPIHCSDKKRKSFYIKDKDIWIKDENNFKILDGVKEITHKQFGAIQQWATYNKDWLDVEKKQDFFNMSISELSKAKKEKYLNKLIIKLTGLSLK
jgi:hypothetical protein